MDGEPRRGRRAGCRRGGHPRYYQHQTNKIQRITQYQTKDYVQGKKIFDIDAASK
jgi:hypothetical protein